MSYLRLLLLKPTHYDDEGYLVQWWRSLVPNHSLAVINGILLDAQQRQVLGPDVTVEIKVIDEIARVVHLPSLLTWLRGGQQAAVMLVGVQTSQYPRAVDLAREFISDKIPVLMGGFHVSGIQALTPEWEQGLSAARESGISLYAGELEDGIDELLVDIWGQQIKPLYNRLAPNIDMEKAPIARLDKDTTENIYNTLVGMDLGRGCPYLCSFCTVINVHGRRPRQRKAEAAVDYVRQCALNNIHRFLVIDDNFARNQNWESICDSLIALKEREGMGVELFIQSDTRATKIPRFLDKVTRAGCNRVFIGIESVRDDNLIVAAKKQNKRSELGTMANQWREAGVMLYGAFIIGFPNDTPERIAEDIRFIQEYVPLEVLEFFILTPLPGSVDHQRLIAANAPLDNDFNHYTDEQPVSEHPLMTHDEWLQLYRDAWEWYYTDEHMERTLRRSLRDKLPVKEVLASLVLYYGLQRYEGVHPLVGGLIRRRQRHQRRHGLPIEAIWRFWPKSLWRTFKAQAGLFSLWLKLRLMLYRIQKEPATDD